MCVFSTRLACFPASHYSHEFPVRRNIELGTSANLSPSSSLSPFFSLCFFTFKISFITYALSTPTELFRDSKKKVQISVSHKVKQGENSVKYPTFESAFQHVVSLLDSNLVIHLPGSTQALGCENGPPAYSLLAMWAMPSPQATTHLHPRTTDTTLRGGLWRWVPPVVLALSEAAARAPAPTPVTLSSSPSGSAQSRLSSPVSVLNSRSSVQWGMSNAQKSSRKMT